ncbi:uncharacterized protein LOC124273062 [Haliotis rubra]|uniref:uncharacterized protein LOC124273062 n=1 Tax=Haliotis rubra TaxID=36100 RepID=UPI001EE63661|nr:uncharacterized protein LOC124273062 [Haliotis rubra]
MTDDKPPEIVPRKRPPKREQEVPLRFIEGDDDYTMKEFYEQFRNSLPKTVVATQGSLGDIDLETFCSGQVMYIHTTTQQTRVVARDNLGRTFSIPRDYSMKFQVVKSRGKVGPAQSLKELLDENELPLQVKFAVPKDYTFHIGCDQQKVQNISNWALVEEYEESYMIANCINTRTIDKKSVLVPVYLKDLLIAFATGLEGKTEEEWKEYELFLAEEMKSVQVDLNVGNKDIAFYSDESLGLSDNVYDYIEPKEFLTFKRLSATDDDGYGVVDDDDNIYTPINEDDVYIPRPPIPKREPKTAPMKSKSKSESPEKDQKNEPSSPTGSETAHGYVNDIPRKEVAPFRLFKGLLKGKQDGAKSSVKGNPGNVAVKDLSIAELGKKMKELKLEKHIAAFKKQLIDGTIALELTKEILQNDFGFSAVDAIKMMGYIQSGHIPK